MKTHPKKKQKKRTAKQVTALLCVILLICLYIFTFIAACFDFPNADKLFPICLMATIGLPILLWIYIWLYGVIREKHTIASADLLRSDSFTGTRLSPESGKEPDNDAPPSSDTLITLRKSASSVSKNKQSKRSNDIQ